MPADTFVVIAAYNEARVIADVVRGVVSAGYPVIVVDDGSHDETAAAARVPGVTVVRHAVNLGQGAALQTGIDYAVRSGARTLVTFDADGQHDPADIEPLVAALRDADIALGSRFLGKEIEGAGKGRKTVLRAATVVSNWLSGLQLTDAHCGLRAFRTRSVEDLRISQNRMAHASELLTKIHVAKLRVVEVPVTVRYTAHSKAKGQGALQAVRILFDYFFHAS